MKHPINKRLPRELRNNIGRYAGLFLLVLIAVGMVLAFVVSADSISRTTEAAYETARLEDGYFVTYTPITEETEELLKEQGILAYPDYYKEYENTDQHTLRIFAERSDVSIPALYAGEQIADDQEVLIERIYAAANAYEPGDLITIAGTELKVAGIVTVPDYTSPLQQTQDVVTDGESFGLVFVSGHFYDTLDEPDTYKYAWYYENRESDNAAGKELENIVKDTISETYILTEFVTTETNPRLEALEGKLNTNRSVAEMFMVVVVIMIAFLFMVVSNHTIEEESSIIGTLFSSGYMRGEILKHYMILPAVVVTAGAGIGCILGHTLFIPLVANGFYDYYSIPDMELYLVPEIILPSLLLPVVLILVINFISIYRKLGITPLKLLRKDLGKEKQGKGREFKSVSFLGRFQMRVLMSSKGNYMMLFIGLVLAGWLMMFGVGMGASFDTYKEDIAESSISEYQYLLKVPYEPEEGIYEKAVIQSFQTWFDMDDRDISITVLGISEDTYLWQELEQTRSREQIYLADAVASKLTVNDGDLMSFTDIYTDETYELMVEGTYHYANGLYAFMNLEHLNELVGNESDYFNCLFSDEPLTIPEEYLVTAISSEDVEQGAVDVKAKMEGMIQMLEVVAVLLYIIVMYLLVKLVIDKHTLNISLLKVFGYDDREINKLYLSGTFWTVLISILIALPLDYQLMQLIWPACIASLNGYLSFAVSWQVCGIIVGIGIVSYIVVNMQLMRHVKRIDMTESLKDRE